MVKIKDNLFFLLILLFGNIFIDYGNIWIQTLGWMINVGLIAHLVGIIRDISKEHSINPLLIYTIIMIGNYCLSYEDLLVEFLGWTINAGLLAYLVNKLDDLENE